MTAAQLLNQASDVVVLEERRTRSGHCVAAATLNFEKTLNSLSLPMIEILAPQLERWAARSDVVAVLLRGAGERAFCAGGDIQALYRGMVRNHAEGREVDDYPRRFFESEYRLDYAIHTYPKPVIAFGHGVVMGGGLGLFSASQFRLVTERSRVAMPEVTIGLFPDAGASWILRGLPQQYAAWLGMTGTHLAAADALHIGLGTHAIAAAAWPALVDALVGATWTGETKADRASVERSLASVDRPTLPDSALAAHRAMLEDALPTLPKTVRDTVQALTSLAGRGDYIDKGLATMRSGCPTSVGIVQGQLERIGPMTLADTFRMELTLATHCANNPDFLEGVRALIIDKDNRPRWTYGSVDALPAEYVASHFEAPWPVHPLADLGEA
ncbi:MAG TPA: enoyl-CoA hydratase/isomerase family protein [Pseudomonadales bacterium]|nr:enoyl-CoA hydratase/isomerase family protein [Pseudomonadales bacterium]